jgi:hypothetical protein
MQKPPVCRGKHAHVPCAKKEEEFASAGERGKFLPLSLKGGILLRYFNLTPYRTSFLASRYIVQDTSR